MLLLCISLPHRADRRAGFTASAAAAGFGPFTFTAGVVCRREDLHPNEHANMEAYGVGPGPWREAYYPRAVGCNRAHIKALHKFLDSGESLALIAEDDARFVPGAAARTAALLKSFEVHCPTWELLNLDPHHRKAPVVCGVAGLVVLTGARTAGAIVYSRRGALRLLTALTHGGRENDFELELQAGGREDHFGASPALAWQEPGFSDAVKCNVALANSTKSNA